MNLPVERRIGFSGRHGVGWNGCRSTLRSCRFSPQLTHRNLSLPLAFRACASAARCNGSPRADRRPSKRRDCCGDPLACNGRADGWLVRRAADTAGRSTAWAAPRHYGDAVIATEDGLGCGDGCRCGDRRECRHSCDGVASVAATLGGRRRRCRGGSPPHDRVGARSRSGLFTDIARIARPLRHHWPHARGCAAPTDAVVGCPKSISDQAGSGCWHWLGPASAHHPVAG